VKILGSQTWRTSDCAKSDRRALGGGRAEVARGQAEANPAAFMTLVGKILPLEVTGKGWRRDRYSMRWRLLPAPPHPPPIRARAREELPECMTW
jgi:hypothetical protein